MFSGTQKTVKSKAGDVANNFENHILTVNTNF